MKLDIQEILERFALIASLPMEEAVGYTALCSDAAERAYQAPAGNGQRE